MMISKRTEEKKRKMSLMQTKCEIVNALDDFKQMEGLKNKSALVAN